MSNSVKETSGHLPAAVKSPYFFMFGNTSELINIKNSQLMFQNCIDCLRVTPACSFEISCSHNLPTSLLSELASYYQGPSETLITHSESKQRNLHPRFKDGTSAPKLM